MSSAFMDLNETETDETQGKNTKKRKRTLSSSIPAKRKYAWKGREWIMFKPLKANSLYYKIIYNSENIEDEVADWIYLYKMDYQKAVYQFLQFTVDICGYQKLNIKKIFSLEKGNFVDINLACKENLTEAHYDSKFLFKGTSQWATRARTAVCNFVTKLMEGLYNENLLFTDCDKFTQHLLSIFVNFILTNIRALLYTGSIIGKNTKKRKRTLSSSIPAKRKYAWKGREWIMFKPLKANSLYYKIIYNSENIEDEVADWIYLYKMDYQKAVYQFLQFTVDICGYQKLNIKKIFSLEKGNFVDINLACKENLTEAHYDSKFLFKGTSQWATRARTAVCNFVTKLMEGLYNENLLFTDCDKFTQHLLSIFVNFILTNIRALLYTGSIIVSKLCSVCLNIEEELENLESSTLPELVNNQVCVKNYITFFLKIIKNSWINDSLLVKMKLAVLNQMGKWFKKNLFIVMNYITELLNILMDSILCRWPEIRLKALNTFEHLIKMENFKNCAGFLLPDIIAGIADRIMDIDYNVATSAVELLTEILKRDPTILIPTKYGITINNLVYCEFCPLARSAGNFFSQVLNLIRNITSFQIMKYLVQFHQTIENADGQVELLVDSLLPWLDEIKNVELMIEMLLHYNSMEPKDQIVLIEILTSSMEQMITNECKFVRVKWSMHEIHKEEVQKAIFHFITKFIPLYEKFCTHNIETQLLKILVLIDYEHLDNQLNDHIVEISKRLMQNFDRTNNNEESLQNISQFLALVKYFNFNNAVISNEILTLTQRVITIFMQILERVDQDLITNEDHFAVECNLLHVSVLIRYHSLIQSIDSSSFFFKNIFKLETLVANKKKTCILKICSYYLLWKLKLAELNNCPEEELQYYTKYFVSHCFILLSDKDNTSICHEILAGFVEFLLRFNEVLLTYKNMLKDKNISIVFDKNQNLDFMKIAVIIIFEDLFCVTLVQKKQILLRVLTLIHFKTIDVLELRKLYLFYYQFYDVYGSIFDEYLKALRKAGTIHVSAMIVGTLIYAYFGNMREGVLENNKLVLFENLLEQFRKFVRRNKKEVIQILEFTITYISRSETRYQFLFYNKQFSKGLPQKDKMQIVSFLLDKIPIENKNNVYVLDFMKFCNTKFASKSKSIAINENISSESGNEDEDELILTL